MAEEKLNNSSEELKGFLKGLKEALLTLRVLLVALIAVFITLVQEIFDIFVAWRANKQLSEESGSEEPYPETAKDLHPINYSPPQTSRLMTDKKTLRIGFPWDLNNLLYPTLATISTIALGLGSARLGPISKWAEIQNKCIEENTLVSANNQKSNLAKNVMNCNGGHE